MEHTRTLRDWKFRRGVERCQALFGEDNNFATLNVVVSAIETECKGLDRQWAEIGKMVF